MTHWTTQFSEISGDTLRDFAALKLGPKFGIFARDLLRFNIPGQLQPTDVQAVAAAIGKTIPDTLILLHKAVHSSTNMIDAVVKVVTASRAEAAAAAAAAVHAGSALGRAQRLGKKGGLALAGITGAWLTKEYLPVVFNVLKQKIFGVPEKIKEVVAAGEKKFPGISQLILDTSGAVLPLLTDNELLIKLTKEIIAGTLSIDDASKKFALTPGSLLDNVKKIVAKLAFVSPDVDQLAPRRKVDSRLKPKPDTVIRERVKLFEPGDRLRASEVQRPINSISDVKLVEKKLNGKTYTEFVGK